ncbi:hypothetical protein CWE22_08990 [Pseudidiomarina aestuarii]|uniref:Type I restriction modification DNA specificity domain-containing protein n=1 Tax=Pseudidiomarina aestuarii TaxID=624146 RepID=A0A7Z6ZS74_9GAMM|nr:restriction endonuclease subunit S [Pseudidiomarina aestuarii]RUO39427.1 hypothetical protein CWE22_08990 [Pseudidiomarina aestuarii]
MEQVLYSLPDDWEYKKLKALIKMHYGKALKACDRVEGEVPVFGSNGVVGSHNECLWSEPTVVIGRKGSVGEANFSLTPSWTIDTAYYVEIIDHDVLDLKYFFYFADRFDASSISQKGVKPGINRNDYLDLNLPLPPFSEQKRIVEKLDALFTRIDTAIEHLQENLVTSKSLLASALFEKFHQEVNSTPIKEIFNVYNGRAYKKSELLDSGKYKVIRIQNLKGGENYYYSDLELDESKYCESGDLLFSWSGTPGTSFGAFIWNDEKAIYHYHIWKMEPKVEIAPRYAYWVLKDITEEAIANARGVAGMLHITKGTMESFIVSLPSYQAQQKVAKELDELALKSEQLQTEISSKIESLKHLKASILDSAFKGEL